MNRPNWFRFFRRPAPSRFARKRLGRSFRHEALEPRLPLTATAVGDEVLVNDLALRSQTTESATMSVALSEINRVVVFNGYGHEDSEGVYANVFDETGTEIRDTFLVNSTIAGEQSTAAVASDGAGNFVVVWAGRGNGDRQGIFFQRYNAMGVAEGIETLVNNITGGDQVSPAVAMNDDGSFAIAWSGVGAGDAAGVFVRRFDDAGVAVTEQQLVNTTTDNQQRNPAVVFDSSGNMVVAWTGATAAGHTDVFGQRYNSEGTALGAEFTWNSTTADCQEDVTLAAGPDGEVVAAWESRAQDGDNWGVVARRLDADGTTMGDEILLNDTTAGSQVDVSLDIAEDGQWLAVWTTGSPGADGWEVEARTFLSDGTPETAAFAVNTEMAGANSGHQQYASVAIAGDAAAIVWSGMSTGDRDGISLQAFDVALIDDGPQQTPNLAPIADRTGSVGTELEVTVTATDPNPRDTLTFILDPDGAPDDATIEQTGNNSAVIRWTPSADDDDQAVLFRVIVTDDGDPPLGDFEEFTVTVEDAPLGIDLNGPATAGTSFDSTFGIGLGRVPIVDATLEVVGADGGMLTGATATLTGATSNAGEQLFVNPSALTGTNISVSYRPADRRLTMSGEDTVENYEGVLRSLTYLNNAADPTNSETVSIQVTDASSTSDAAIANITIGVIDLVGFAQALATANADFAGAAWNQNTTNQRELFQDGGQFLPFTDITDADRTLNSEATARGITSADQPVWIFENGNRLEGVQTLQAISAASGVAIPIDNENPFIAPVTEDLLLVGSPLHVSIDGYDSQGGALTYSVSTDNAGVTAELLVGNRSARVDVAGYGDMVFELFEQRTSRATNQFISLAEDDFYNGVIFHRIIDNFVIQGGDPLGDGTGGSNLGDFDDQFNVDLQHNRSGLLSYAKGADDTNDSQFFITEGASDSLRNLDFNHSIFGVLSEGEAIRAAISDTEVERQSQTNNEISRPVVDIVMNSVEIFTDTENATLMLKADAGVSGPVEVTVTATDEDGNTFTETFTVDVQNDFDTVGQRNGRPFLGDIAPVTTSVDTPAVFTLTAMDVEGDPFVFSASQAGSVNYTFDVVDNSDGTATVTVTPPTGFTGEMIIVVQVERETPFFTSEDPDSQLVTITVG